jgi:DNA-binding PadR family transcriptional regulator
VTRHDAVVPSPGRPRQVLRHALLGLLAERPMSGYELAKLFERSISHTWPARHSQIYPELIRLADDGLVEAGEAEARGRRTYAITPQGREAVRAWLAETQPDRAVRDESLLRTTFLWLMAPDVALAHLEAERDGAQTAVSELRALAALRRPATPAERAQRIVLEAELRAAQARADWADWALLRLADEHAASASSEPPE